jgi:hypothetical protein
MLKTQGLKIEAADFPKKKIEACAAAKLDDALIYTVYI